VLDLDFRKDGSLLELLSVPGQDPAITRIAIEEGADVNETSPHGFTPLMLAALLNDNPCIVRTLLQNGADVNAETHDGMTALMLSLLTETYDHTAQDLSQALEREENRRCTAMELIRGGADVNAVCYSPHWRKWTPLLFATLDPDRNASIIFELLAAKVSVHVRSEEGVTPLMHAVSYGRSSDVVHALIATGADVNAKSAQEGRKNWTPLLYAIASPYRNVAVVRELVLGGADVNVTTSNGSTPLLIAVNLEDDPSFVKLLLDAGANDSIEDKDGNSPLDCAKAKNYTRIVNLLSKARSLSRNDIAKVKTTY
jgi:ankyrin repeat protein